MSNNLEFKIWNNLEYVSEFLWTSNTNKYVNSYTYDIFRNYTFQMKSEKAKKDYVQLWSNHVSAKRFISDLKAGVYNSVLGTDFSQQLEIHIKQKK